MSLGTRTRQWVVLLEAVDEEGNTPIDAASFSRLIDSWVEETPTSLFSPGRYAIQVCIEAASPPSALSAALWHWTNALRRAGLPDWELVRAELLTPEELEREIQLSECAPAGDGAQLGLAVAPAHAPDAMEDELLRRALHDGLTGLMSREMFLDAVRKAVASDVPGEAAHGVVVVDLAGFRSDVGAPDRAAGDEMLVEMVGRLAATVRRADSIASVGVDELAVLVDVRSFADLGRVAERIGERVGAPLVGPGGPVVVTASLGAAMASRGDDPDVLIAEAEDAMRSAKEAGGGYRLARDGAEPAAGELRRSPVPSGQQHA